MQNLLQVPFSFHSQWMYRYPKYVLFHYDGNKHFIRVRRYDGKCFFADGLKEFRRAHDLNESVILRFVAFDKNTTFFVHVIGPTQRQLRVKPVISTRRYIFTTDVTKGMIQRSLSLVGFTAPLIIYDHLSFLFSFHFLLIPSWSNCLTIPFLLHFSYRYFHQQLQDLSMLQKNLLPFNVDWQNAPTGTSPSTMMSHPLPTHGSTFLMKKNWCPEMR